jgi:hypothetical protein
MRPETWGYYEALIDTLLSGAKLTEEQGGVLCFIIDAEQFALHFHPVTSSVYSLPPSSSTCTDTLPPRERCS